MTTGRINQVSIQNASIPERTGRFGDSQQELTNQR